MRPGVTITIVDGPPPPPVRVLPLAGTTLLSEGEVLLRLARARPDSLVDVPLAQAFVVLQKRGAPIDSADIIDIEWISAWCREHCERRRAQSREAFLRRFAVELLWPS